MTESTDLEIDALAAERVMGCQAGQCESKCYVDHNNDHWSVSSMFGHPGARAFHPTSDPSTDYLVLVKVRGSWDRRALKLFDDRLRALWVERFYDPRLRGRGASYEPGDYARAALRAIERLERRKGE